MKPYIADDDFTLYHGDCLDVLPTIGSVDAIVTSPPYAGLRGASAPDVYVDWLRPVLASLRDVLAPRGGFMLNLGRAFLAGEETPYIEETLFAARELGWKRIDTLIWRKTNPLPYGAPQYLINAHEVVYWLALDVNAYRGYTSETRHAPSPETIARRARRGLRGPKNREDGEYVEKPRTPINPSGVRPESVFECTIGRDKGIDHDEVMALDLAEHLVALACPPGGVVLDPFAGSCTTAVAARKLGRRSICIEVDDCAECGRRLAQQALSALRLDATP